MPSGKGWNKTVRDKLQWDKDKVIREEERKELRAKWAEAGFRVHPEPLTLNPQPGVLMLRPKPRDLNTTLLILDPKPLTLHPEP